MRLEDTFRRLAIALALGLLVGLQRERTDARLAGFRTFPLVTLLGALTALLAPTLGNWTFAAALAGLSLVIVSGNLPLWNSGKDRPGVTTEVALLVMFALGALVIVGSPAVVVAVAGVVAVLLQLKSEMHSFAARIGDRDFTAMMQFTLISLVILPVLPNQFYGPFHVLNPHRIWLMVVLIVGISLGGYVTYKFVGPRAGIWASGVLGGLISSTATTVSIARRDKLVPSGANLAAFVILLASAIVFIRLMLLIGATARPFLPAAIVPLATLFLLLGAAALWNLRGGTSSPAPALEQENPTELKSALIFGALYAAVLLAVAAAKEYFGDRGVYVIAVLSGLTDMDAITLSVSQMVNHQTVSTDTGWRLILVASLANLVFKGGTVVALSERHLIRRVLIGFGVAILGCGLLLAFLPAPPPLMPATVPP